MKKSIKIQGFTLTELVAVIVILSLIISLSTIIYIGIDRDVLQSKYDNLVFYLEDKAISYATSTNILSVTVEDLIKAGYVTPDDGINVFDPRDSSSLNCYLIEVKNDNGNYTSKFTSDVGRRDDGSCNNYTRISNVNICEVVNG